MDFRIPDEAGNQPKNAPICGSQDINSSILTRLDAEYLTNCLHSEFEGQVRLSLDAGEYICNYTFYRNLETCQSLNNTTGLFVHFPTFANVSEPEQEKFIKRLLCKLGECEF